MKRLVSVLSAAVILLIIIIAIELAVSLIKNPAHYAPASMMNPSAEAQAAGQNANAQPAKKAKEVVQLDYLYAGWCEYCNETTPLVESVAYELGANMKLSEYDEALRKTDANVLDIYNGYKESGMFTSFPTLVAKGEKGEAALVGKKSRDEIKEWVCSQFETMPAECR